MALVAVCGAASPCGNHCRFRAWGSENRPRDRAKVKVDIIDVPLLSTPFHLHSQTKRSNDVLYPCCDQIYILLVVQRINRQHIGFLRASCKEVLFPEVFAVVGVEIVRFKGEP